MVCPYGPLKYTHVGGKGRGSTHVGGKGGGRKGKNDVFESVVFSWFAHTGLYSTHAGAREEVENEKTTF